MIRHKQVKVKWDDKEKRTIIITIANPEIATSSLIYFAAFSILFFRGHIFRHNRDESLSSWRIKII